MDKLSILKNFKAALTTEQFILGGSTALAYYGLLPEGKAKDLDIILVNPDENTLSLLEKLQEISPAKTKPLKGSNARVNYIIDHFGVKIDFFVLKDRIDTEFEYKGILLNTIPNIVKAKKEANRPKDWLQLRNLSRFFFKQEEFTNYSNEF
jgi:hypothetical protein